MPAISWTYHLVRTFFVKSFLFFNFESLIELAYIFIRQIGHTYSDVKAMTLKEILMFQEVHKKALEKENNATKQLLDNR